MSLEQCQAEIDAEQDANCWLAHILSGDLWYHHKYGKPNG